MGLFAVAVTIVGGWRGIRSLIALALTPHMGVILTSMAVPGTWYHTVLPQVFTMLRMQRMPSASFSTLETGAFVQDTWRAAPGLELVGGVRLVAERGQ